jgi:hypothetical protein
MSGGMTYASDYILLPRKVKKIRTCLITESYNPAIFCLPACLLSYNQRYSPSQKIAE